MIIDPKANLLKLFNKNRLGHFYILSPPENENDDISENTGKENKSLTLLWCYDFMAKAYKTSLERVSHNNHPDIFEWTSEDSDKEYSQQCVKQFTHFLSLGSFEGGHRFVVIPDANKLTVLTSNKILKSLEEPGEDITIFLLKKNGRTLLPTVESRGINLTIPNRNKKKGLNRDFKELLREYFANENGPKDFSEKISHFCEKGAGIHDVIDDLKKVPSLRKPTMEFSHVWLNNLLRNHERQNKENENQSFAKIEEYLKATQWFETSEKFNNSSQERFFQLLHALRSNASKLTKPSGF